MKLFRKIDTTTGNFLEDVLFESHPVMMDEQIVESMDELGNITQYSEWVPVLDAEGNPQPDPQYVEEAPPQGLYLPKWTGTEWVEGGQAPEPIPQPLTLEERVVDAENTLLSLLFM